ncbi:MAG: methyltransferase domain-containing protein [archaeon]
MRQRKSKDVRRTSRRVARMDVAGLRTFMDRYDRARGLQEKGLNAFTDWSKHPHVYRAIRERVPRARLMTPGRYLSYYAEIHHLLTSTLGNVRGKHIVHVGSSIPYYMEFLRAIGAKGTAVDIDPRAAKSANAIGFNRFIQGDVGHLPLRTRSVDAFISDHFLLSNFQHLRWKTARMMDELHRVLRSKGFVLFAESEFQPGADMGEKEFLESKEANKKWEIEIMRPAVWKLDRGGMIILRKK